MMLLCYFIFSKMPIINKFFKFFTGKCCSNCIKRFNPMTGLTYCDSCGKGYIKTYRCGHFDCRKHVSVLTYMEDDDTIYCPHCHGFNTLYTLLHYKTKIDKNTQEPLGPVNPVFYNDPNRPLYFKGKYPVYYFDMCGYNRNDYSIICYIHKELLRWKRANYGW